MKLAAINEINKLDDENTIKEILNHLVEISKASNKKFNAESFFDKTAEKYDDILQKLAK